MGKKQITTLTALGLTGAWLALALFVMSRHEIWLDEAQHWLLARDSDSLGELYRNMKYEGHPPLWNVLLFSLAAFSDSPAVMQYVHLAFAGGTIFLIVRYSPFPLWVKLILPFTYFLGYEYAIIARNYAPAVFFMMLACVMAKDTEKNLVRISFLFAIAVLFHVYVVVAAFVLLSYFIYKLREKGKPWSVGIKPMTILVIAGLIAFWFLWRMPSDHYLFMYKNSSFPIYKAGTVLLMPFSSLLHFPDLTNEYWWNTNLFLQGSDIFKGIIGIIFWIMPAVVFRNNRPLLITYLVGVILLSFALGLTPSFIALRHAGFVALLFFICVWLGGKLVTDSGLSKAILGLFIVVQFCSYWVTAFKEYAHPFSNGKNVVETIEGEYPNLKVGVFPVFVGPPISAYLNQKLFYGKYQTENSFADWSSRSMVVFKSEFIPQCKDYMKHENLDSMIVVSHVGWESFELDAEELQLLETFEGAATDAENYKVYLLKQE